MLKITDLPSDISPQEIKDVANSVYRHLLQNGEEQRINEERHFQETMDTQDPVEYEQQAWAYIARRDELAARDLKYTALLEDLQDLHDRKEGEESK